MNDDLKYKVIRLPGCCSDHFNTALRKVDTRRQLFASFSERNRKTRTFANILSDISFEMRDKRTKKMSHPFISTLIVCDFCCQRDSDK